MGPDPGYLEIDLVAHCGGNMAGSFIQTLAVTDVATGWVEAVPLLAREQTLVTEALGVIGSRLPVSTLGVDSDNDSVFICQTLIDYCRQRGDPSSPVHGRIAPMTRPTSSRRTGRWFDGFAGYERFAGLIAGQALARLFTLVSLYTNYFQPSFKLIAREKIGSRTRKRYDRPQTPCQRLLAHPAVAETVKEWLRATRSRLDPLFLLSEIRAAQSALATLAAPEERWQGAEGRSVTVPRKARSSLARGRCQSNAPAQSQTPLVANSQRSPGARLARGAHLPAVPSRRQRHRDPASVNARSSRKCRPKAAADLAATAQAVEIGNGP